MKSAATNTRNFSRFLLMAQLQGQEIDFPLSLIIGLACLVIGLGSQLWGVAIVGGILLGYWVLRRYPPRKA